MKNRYVIPFSPLCQSVQDLESECLVQQREQVSALTVLSRSLREEHQAKLQRLRRNMEQMMRGLPPPELASRDHYINDNI